MYIIEMGHFNSVPIIKKVTSDESFAITKIAEDLKMKTLNLDDELITRVKGIGEWQLIIKPEDKNPKYVFYTENYKTNDYIRIETVEEV